MLTPLLLLALKTSRTASPPPAPKAAEITLDTFFPKKSLRGKTPRGMAWSEDGRYLAYVWNPYDDHGSDLWVYDTVDSKAIRLTSIDMMADFDRELPPIIERYKKDKAEEDRRKALGEAERKKLEDQDEEKEKTDKTPKPDYNGVTSFEWAHKTDELMFIYKGDIYRVSVATDKPSRLTNTREPEMDAHFTKDDQGFYFRRGDGLYRMRFDSSYVQELNPELPKGMTMAAYSLSPDETKLMVAANHDTAPERSVSYISYRGRFAQAMTTPRNVADDTFNTEQYLYLYDLNDDPKANPKNDGKPWQIYYWPAGKDWGQTSLAEQPWSPDSKRFVFATWKRDEKELAIQVANVDTKKTDIAFKEYHHGGHTTPGMAAPMFLPDGRIVAMLEDSGYRHAWIVDPATQKASQLTKGDFEVYPFKVSKDGRTVWATSDMTSTTRNEVFAIDTADGRMAKLSSQLGRYDQPAIDPTEHHFAAMYTDWSTLPELYLFGGSQEKPITQSHAKGAEIVYSLKAIPFSFQDRHGYIVHGFLYLPKDYRRSDKRPLWIYTYGGPLGTTKYAVEGQSISFNLYMTMRYGYITADVDPRGMSGYGGAFEAANWEQPGKPQVDDLTDAVKYLEVNYGIDENRVGINGWSFGGFQTQMCMYTAPDVFKLGIAGAGPTEWQNYNTWYTGGVIGFSELGKPDNLDRYSLTKLAKNLQGPLMLLHGMEDTNVLFQDTIHVYQALLAAGKGPLVELVLDPTGNHGLGGDIKPKQQYAIYERFLLEHWGPYLRK